MTSLPGRKAQAARNDEVILTAAREVFLDDPKAPVAAVAERAGVGISALYRRYPGKEDLLRTLCHDGLRRFLAIAAEADRVPDAGDALTHLLTGLVDADVHSLTTHLAGTFTPTAEMTADAARAGDAAGAIVDRAVAGGRLRPGVGPTDVTLVLEACAAIRVPDPDRTRELRRRVLAALLTGLSTGGELPGPAPTPAEMSWRWR